MEAFCVRLRILGSGGMFQIPNPFCKCKICEEARVKRGRYERLGPSLYIDDISMLIDTPEDIAVSCDRQGISDIKYISISHKDPDHTRGIRIVEPLGYDGIADKGHPIKFIALPEVIEDIDAWNGGTLKFYENVLNCISIEATDYIKIDDIEIYLISNKTHRGNMTFYLFKQADKKVIYACCDNKPFIENEMYYDADILIIGLVSDNGILKDGSKLEDAPFRDEMYSLEEIKRLKEQYRIKKVVITHIDEYWGKSYAYYQEFEKTLDGIQFAYDGMTIDV
jgi:phosphoribosyl 1,2-cyclic phosphate phosphodiesterase